jgi:hypothetical protein
MDPEGIYGGKEGAGLPPKAPLREPGQRVNAVNGLEHSKPAADGLDIPNFLPRRSARWATASTTSQSHSAGTPYEED